MENKTSKIKIKIGKGKKKRDIDIDQQGPQMNDLSGKQSRWKKLPVKNVVTIRESGAVGQKPNHNIRNGILIILAALILALVVIFFAYTQIFRPTDDAALLIPEDSSIYAKVNIDKFLGQELDETDVLSRYDFVGTKVRDEINKQIFDWGISYGENLKDILGEYLHIAYIKSDEANGFAFITKLRDLEMAQNILEDVSYKVNIEKSDYEGVEIVKIAGKENGNSVFISLLGQYLVISKKELVVKNMIDVSQGTAPNITQNSRYNNLKPLLDLQSVASIYVNVEKVVELIPSENNMGIYWKAITHNMSDMFINIESEQDGIKVEIEGKSADGVGNGKVSTKLAEYLPLETTAFVMGRNLMDDYDNLRKGLIESDPAWEVFLSDKVGSIEEGSNINFSNGFLADFTGEYIFSIDYDGDLLNYNFITDIKGVENVDEKKSQIEDAILNYIGSKHPKKQDMELEDGTIVGELVPDPDSYCFSDLDFEGDNIRTIINPDIDENYSYVIKENTLIVSTSLASLKNILLTKDEANKLVNKRYFNIPFQEVASWTGEGYIYMDAQDVFDIKEANGNLSKFLQAFDNMMISFSSGQDRVSMKGYLFLE